MNVDGYAFRLNCGDLTCSFGADGKLAMIENGYISAVYTRTANNLFVEDQARNITAVRLNTDGKPDNIMISRYDAAALDVVNKYVQYQWTDGIDEIHGHGKYTA